MKGLLKTADFGHFLANVIADLASNDLKFL
jgi:hypothetical protein